MGYQDPHGPGLSKTVIIWRYKRGLRQKPPRSGEPDELWLHGHDTEYARRYFRRFEPHLGRYAAICRLGPVEQPGVPKGKFPKYRGLVVEFDNVYFAARAVDRMRAQNHPHTRYEFIADLIPEKPPSSFKGPFFKAVTRPARYGRGTKRIPRAVWSALKPYRRWSVFWEMMDEAVLQHDPFCAIKVDALLDQTQEKVAREHDEREDRASNEAFEEPDASGAADGDPLAEVDEDPPAEEEQEPAAEKEQLLAGINHWHCPSCGFCNVDNKGIYCVGENCGKCRFDALWKTLGFDPALWDARREGEPYMEANVQFFEDPKDAEYSRRGEENFLPLEDAFFG